MPHYYNTYRPGRTRPHPLSEAHWKGLYMHIKSETRQEVFDPAHQVPINMRYNLAIRNRQGRETRAASLTPW